MPADGAVFLDDQVETAQEQLVEQVSQRLLSAVTPPGAPISRVLAQVAQDMGVSLAVVRQALSRLVYSGAVGVTEKRELVPE